MKIHLNNKIILLLFIILNVVLFYILVRIFSLTQETYTFTTNEIPKSSELPVLNKSVEQIRTNSKAFIIYDPASRAIVAGKNEKLRFAPASSAKIMTATIVLEEYPMGKVLTAKGIGEVVGSKMYLLEGENITVRSLLYGLMLPSGNDAAYVLAESYPPVGEASPGGRVGFVKRMNDKAKSLNLSNTHFFDEDGYVDENYTTAFDLARLAAYAMKNPEFAKIVDTKSIVVTDTTGQISHPLTNLNELLGQNGVNGVKTGFTDEAGGVLVTSLVKNGKTYIIVVLNTPDRFGDTRDIIKEAIKNLQIVSY